MGKDVGFKWNIHRDEIVPATRNKSSDYLLNGTGKPIADGSYKDLRGHALNYKRGGFFFSIVQSPEQLETVLTRSEDEICVALVAYEIDDRTRAFMNSGALKWTERVLDISKYSLVYIDLYLNRARTSNNKHLWQEFIISGQSANNGSWQAIALLKPSDFVPPQPAPQEKPVENTDVDDDSAE